MAYFCEIQCRFACVPYYIIAFILMGVKSMKKNVSFLLSVVLIITSVLFTPAMSASAAVYEPDRTLYSEAYMLLSLDDASFPVVAQKNQDKQMYPASLTKIVTAMVVLNNVKDLSQKTKVSQTAYDAMLGTGAQVANLQVGDTLTVEQLLYLTMVHSACDACHVLAEFVAGSTEAFVQMMNAWVQDLGCRNTHFVNPDGLHDKNHYTTASDLAVITLEALKNDTFNQIATTVQYEYDGVNYYHTNLMLQSGYVSYYYEYASGIKTGSTEEAGYCLITKAAKDGYNYLAVVLGAPVIDYNKDGYVEKCSFIDAASLFEWAFDSLKYTTLVSQNDVLDEVAVEDGKDADSVQLVAKEDVNTIVPASLDKSAIIIKPVDKPAAVKAPVEKGQEVCKAEIIYADQTVATVTLVAAKSVELSTFLKILNAVKAFFSLTVVKIILVAAVLFVLVYIYLFISNYRRKKKRREEKMRQYEEMQSEQYHTLDPPKR